MASILQMTYSNPIFLNENITISIQISLKVVPKGPVDNQSGSNPLPEAMLTHVIEAYIATLGGNDLMEKLNGQFYHWSVLWKLLCLMPWFISKMSNGSFFIILPSNIKKCATEITSENAGLYVYIYIYQNKAGKCTSSSEIYCYDRISVTSADKANLKTLLFRLN